MFQPDIHPRPGAIVSLIAAITVAAVAGVVAEIARRVSNEIAILDPQLPYDPYYGLAEYAFSVVPER